jgi:hypothetical protein
LYCCSDLLGNWFRRGILHWYTPPSHEKKEIKKGKGEKEERKKREREREQLVSFE